MTNLQSIPRRLEGIKQKLEDDRLMLSVAGNVIECPQADGIVWALCDGRSSVEQIGSMIATISGLDLGADPATYVQNAVERFARDGFLQLFESEPVVYPINIRSFTHLVSTRGGLYAINDSGYRRLASGMFFGLCLDERNNFLVYEFPHLSSSQWGLPFNQAKQAETNEGVVHLVAVEDGHLAAPSGIVTGIGNNCHYLSHHDGVLYIVDTEAQAVWEIDSAGRAEKFAVFQPHDYHHINTIALHGHTRLVMKCLRSRSDFRSGFGIFDEAWNLIEEIDLPAERAHDFLLDEHTTDAPAFWYCDSNNAHIRHYPSNRAIHVEPPVPGNSTTRGLSQTGRDWVVGGGRYGEYDVTAVDPPHNGAVSFIDKRSGQLEARVMLPEAPCCIVRNPWHSGEP